MTQRPRLTLGRAAAWLCAISVMHLIGFIVLISTSEHWFGSIIEGRGKLLALMTAFGFAQVLLGLGIIGAGRAAQDAILGTTGRARVLLLAGTGVIYLVFTTLTGAILLWAAHASKEHLIGGTISGLLFGLTNLAELPFDTAWIEPVFRFVSIGSACTATVMLVLCVYCWFLIRASVRTAFWRVLDVALFALFILATARFSLDPAEGSSRQLIEAVFRLTVTTLLVVRIAVRLTSPALSAMERGGFRPMVAARHLRAKKTRFLAANGTLSILAVAVASCMLVTVLSVMGGFRDDLKQKILGNHAHVVIDRDHRTFDPWQAVVDRARGTDQVIGASPYLQGEVMISSLAAQAGAVLRGIDPQTVGQVTDLERNLTQGKLDYLIDPAAIVDPTVTGLRPLDIPGVDVDPTPDPPSAETPPTGAPVLPGVIVGKELARNLRLVVGDRVHLVSPHGALGPSGPIPKSRAFRVAGIFYSGMYEYDMKYAYIALPVAQRFLGAGDGISGVEVKVGELEEAPSVAAALRESLQGTDLRIQDWQELNQHLFGALALEKLAMFITLGIAILVAGFSVFGTLTLLVQEKRREVGILKALGASPRSVIRIFLLEGLLIGMAGALAGLGLGFVVTFGAEHFGIRMNPEVYYIDKLPVQLDPAEFGLVGAAAVIVCMVATVFPAVQASRVRPVDALRYD